MGFVGGSEGNLLASEMAKDIATSKSSRVIISTLHFYIEHVLHRLIQEHFTNSEDLLKSDDRGYVPGYWKKTKILHDNQIIDDMIFQELGLINEIRNEFMHSFEPNNQKILDFCNFLLYHPYNDRKSNVEKSAYDALKIMSQLCKILDKTKNS